GGVWGGVFAMMRLVGGEGVMRMLGETVASSDVIENSRQQLGLNDPLPVQYWRFLSHALQGDLGRSWRSNEPVTKVILEQLPATLQLTVTGLGLAILLGVLLGLLTAVHQNSPIDNASMVVALIGVSMPSFWLG